MVELPWSVSYYRARNGKPGAKASQVKMKLDGALVPNEDVVIRIKKLIDTEFNAFGYEYATHELKKEYLINKKKADAARCTGLCLPMAFY